MVKDNILLFLVVDPFPYWDEDRISYSIVLSVVKRGVGYGSSVLLNYDDNVVTLVFYVTRDGSN